MFVFEDHGAKRPERFRHGGMKIGPLLRLDQDTVIAKRHSKFERMVDQRLVLRDFGSREIVANHQQRVFEMLVMQVDVDFFGFQRVFDSSSWPRCGLRPTPRRCRHQ